jgi:hypothetical protein
MKNKVKLIAMIFGVLAMAGMAPGPAFSENILEKIERTATVTMGFREGSVPFGFMTQGGEWVGFGLDLGYEIHKERSMPTSRMPAFWPA